MKTLKALSNSCGREGIPTSWGYSAQVTPRFGLGAEDCAYLQDMIRKTERAMRKVVNDAHEDARKRGIPPGLVGFR